MLKIKKNFFAVILFLLTVFFTVVGAFSFSHNKEAEALSYGNSVLCVYSQQDFESLSEYQSQSFSQKTIALFCDVDLSDVSFTLKDFYGTLKGNGHTLYGAKKNLFGTIKNSGVVCDVVFSSSAFTGSTYLADYNYGRIENVSFFGTANTSGNLYGAVRYNNGTMKDVSVYLDITSGGDVYGLCCKQNKGTIDGCGFYGSVSVSNGSDLYAFAEASSDSESIVKNCVFASSIVAPSGCDIYPLHGMSDSCEVLIATASTVQVQYLSSTAYTDSYVLCFEKTAESTLSQPDFSYSGKTYDGSGNAEAITDMSDISAKLSSDFVKYGGVLPYPACLWQTDSEDGNTLIQSRGDLMKMKVLLCFNSGQTPFACEINDIILMDGAGAVPSLFSPLFEEEVDDTYFVPARAVLSGQKSVLGIDASSLFAKGFSVTHSVLLNSVGTNYGYDKDVSAVNIVGSCDYEGTGTNTDPYLLETCEQLVGFIQSASDNVAGKYAVLTRHIFVNYYGNSGRKLSLVTLNATLNGCGYSLYGLADEPLFSEIGADGTLTDVSVDVYGENEVGAVLALTDNGTVQRVNLTGTQVAESGFFTNLNGTASCCYNALECDYAFCKTFGEEGILENCLSSAGKNFAESDDGTGCSYCILAEEEGYTLLNGQAIFTRYASADVLEENGYDIDTVFGYTVGGSDSFPSLRTEEGTYKQKNQETVTFEDGTYGDIAFDLSDFSDTFGEQGFTLSWKYNQQTKTVAEGILDAGEYECTLRLDGTDELVPEKRVLSFTVAKADCQVKIFSTTVSTEVSFVYTGEEVDQSADETDKVLQSMRDDYGYDLTFSYSLAGKSITRAQIVGAGTYVVTYKAEATNYTTQTWNRSVRITQAELPVTVSDGTVRYLEEVDFSLFTVTATLLGRDNTKTLADFLPDGKKITDYLACDYTVGAKTGSTFAVTFLYDKIALDDYKWVEEKVTSGTLTVTKALIPQGEITFFGATEKTNGSSAVVYSGSSQTWKAENVPAEFSVKYENNVQKDVGKYTVKATVFDAEKNYEDLVLTVDAEITKAPLRVWANNLTKEYGYAVSLSDYTLEAEGLLGEDTLQDFSVSCRPYREETPVAEETVLSIGTYEVRVIWASDPTNYTVTSEKGTLTITKISLTALYKNNQGEQENFDDLTVTYSGQPFSRTLSFFENENYTIKYTYNGLEKTSVTDAGSYVVRGTVTPKEPSDYAETVYTCNLTVKKQKTSLTFVKENYSYPYVPGGTVDYSAEEYWQDQYTKENISDEYTLTLTCDYESAVHAGTYQMKIVFGGDKNFEASQDTATLTVTPVTADITVTRDYTYQVTAVSPVVTVSGSDEVKQELSAEMFTFTYTETTYGENIPSAIASGSYTVQVACQNKDYVLNNTIFDLVIQPLTVEITLGEISFVYGTFGGYSENNVSYDIREDYIVRYGYYVEETGVTVDIMYRLVDTNSGRYFRANVYDIRDEYIQQKGNYRFTLAEGSTNRVTVTQRVLTNVWLLDGEVCLYNNTVIGYSGTKQNSRFATQTDNYADGQTAVSVGVSLSVKSGGVACDLYQAGIYQLTVRSNDINNYTVEKATSSLTVVIEKSDVEVWIEDASVQQYETFAGITYRKIEGLKGNDKDKTLQELEGAKLRQICDYTLIAHAGATFELSVEGTFDNYNLVVARKGTLTVLKSAYNDYYLHDTVYEYDGTPKSIVFSSVDYGVTVSYSGNGKIDVGTYTVTAIVTYPTGRVTTSVAKLSIVQAVPTVEVEHYYTVYAVNTYLTDDVICGKAYVGKREIGGSFAFRKAENKLVENDGEYAVVFTPTDSHNFAQVNATLAVTSYQIGGYLLTYGGKYEWSSGNLIIDGNVTVQLDKSSIPGIAENISLWINGTEYTRAVFEKEESIVLLIKYGDETVYKNTFSVQFKKEEEPEKVVIDESFFAFDGVEIDLKNNIVYIGENGGRITLSETAGEEYTLLINGKEVGQNGYVLLETEENISLILKHSRLGTVYSRVFSVKDNSQKPTEEIEPEEETGLATYWYYIFGGVGGAALVAVLLIIILKKRS